MSYKYVGTHKGRWTSRFKAIQELFRSDQKHFKVDYSVLEYKVIYGYCASDSKHTHELHGVFEELRKFQEMYEYHGNGD